MGIIFDEPKYPVIDKAPGVWKTIGNFSVKDYATIAGFTALSYPYGYWAGQRSNVAKPSAITAALIGLSAGYLYAYQNSSGRLMGLKPNDKEVEAGLGRR